MTMHYPKTEKEWLELRHKYVSSTESSALFGLSPYATAFELAVSKKEPLAEGIEQTERMTWGLRLQEAIAKGISEDYGVKVRRVRGYATREDVRMGASFDYEIVGLKEENDFPQAESFDPMLRQMYTDLGPGILEIKNVDYYIFKREWKTEDGQLEAPSHIEIQVQHQLHCIGRKWGVMGVLVGGNETQLVLREQDPEVGASIEKKVGEFWALIGKDEMPPIKLPEDVDIIRKLYMSATPGKVMDAQGDAEIEELCRNYKDEAMLRDAHENGRKSCGAKLLLKIGDAEKVLVNGYTISAGTVGETLVEAYTRKSYRNLTVREKKVKTT